MKNGHEKTRWAALVAMVVGACGAPSVPAVAASDVPTDATTDRDDATDATTDRDDATDATLAADARSVIEVPIIDLPWRQIAGQPDLGALAGPAQQPVDFGIWQAADGTWQLWSCIRFTREPGGTRLFYRWEGARFEDEHWAPVGVAMHADTSLGEMLGYLQAPYVFRTADGFHMFYGDGNDVCTATSADGKAFTRYVTPAHVTALYSEGPDTGTRDPMVIRAGDRWIAYDSAFPGGHNGVYARTSQDLVHWSASTLVAEGGAASGDGPYTAECPFVVYRPDSGLYYLFRNQFYGEGAMNAVYASRDPMDFGVGDDSHLVTRLPVAAAEIVDYQGDTYIAALRPGLDGIQLAHLRWVAR